MSDGGIPGTAPAFAPQPPRPEAAVPLSAPATHHTLTAEEILGADDAEIIAVTVPEWKGAVYLRVLSADEGLTMNEQMQALQKEGKSTEAIFLVLGACMVTASGDRIFKTTEEARKLRTRSNKVLLRLQTRALELQGWLKGDAAKNA